MSTGYSKETMAEADAALQKSRAYQARKGEKSLKTVGMYLDILSTANSNASYPYLGDKIAAVSNSQTVTTIQRIAASDAFDTIKSQINHFFENTDILVKVLDEVGKVHPFIQSVLCLNPTLAVIIHSSRCSRGFCVQGCD